MASIGAFNGVNSVLTDVSQIGFRAMNFRQETSTAVTKTQSGRIIRSSVATTLWRATLDFAAITYEQFRQIQGFIALARGSLNDFTIELPNISNRTATAEIQDSATGQLEVSAQDIAVGGVAGSTEITGVVVDTILGATDKTILKMGDVIKFANHDKVYMLSTDITTTGSVGDILINFEPGLVTAVTAGTQIIYNNVPFKMIFANNLQDYRYNVDGTVNARIDVQEVI